jgi:hypothetical protein
MNWIDMSDKDKLFNYAKEFAPDKLRILVPCEDNSYYHDCEDDKICKKPIMEYSIERFDIFKETLMDVWDAAGFKNLDLLASIVSAITLKNMPLPKSKELQDKANKLQNGTIKESYERVSLDDAPPIFVYEF